MATSRPHDLRDEFGWWAVLDSRELRREPLGVRRLGRDLVFWRRPDGSIVAQEDVCPHRRTRLSLGKVQGDCITCPFHGFAFDASGACTRIPAHGDDRSRIPESMKVRTYPTREQHGFVFVWTDATRAPTAEVPWFEELDPSYVYDGLTSDWETHFSRAIENQLDFAHLPFVHASTIGRFATEGATPEVTVGEASVRISFPEGAGGFIEWREPNVWINNVGFGFVMVAFAPVDADHTRMYLRFYQNKVKIPGFTWLFNQVMKPMNALILRQDQAVVEAEEPRDTSPRIEEVLVDFDRAVVAYRALRARRATKALPAAGQEPAQSAGSVRSSADSSAYDS
jgi:phenylpropionate dioxygenase-like ring-hydroxylating dioxygenase large terminal subunit